MKNITSLRLVLPALAVLGGNVAGYPLYHGPFSKGEEPCVAQLEECSLVRSNGLAAESAEPTVYYWAATNDTNGSVVKIEAISETNDCGWRITVLDSRGAALSAPATNDMYSRFHTVQRSDLNQDGRPDFIVNISSGGCGLGGECSTTTFLLSAGEKYVATNFCSFTFGPEDIVRFKKDGPVYFIHNDLVGNGEEKTKDGRDHNFWVYRLYRFSGSQMVPADGDDPRFPKWVWYTFKENHKETDQLTPAQKKRLLRK